MVNAFAKKILTALTYFMRMETIQFLNTDLQAFQQNKQILLNEPPGEYDFIIATYQCTTLFECI